MRSAGFAVWLLIVLLGSSGMAAAVPMSAVATNVHPYDYYEIGDLKAQRPGKTEGGLMLVGGGIWPHEAFRWLVGKAGHGHIVVLRASGAEEAQDELYREVGGAASVQTIVFHAREPASDPKVLAIVRQADGIFLAGGDQSNYVRYWKGTPLNEALNQHVRNGKPLGGTSAGLAIMGAYSYGAMDGGSLTSEEALRDPLAPEVTLIDDFLVLPPLPANSVITDSHFGKRDRLGRLLVFMARV
ncbi:MAG: cyanophycinase, partial [Luteimonas sp.]